MGKITALIICGPTASGKTALGAELAKEYGGEIVSADSMQIYKGMDIATAKPTEEEKQGIPHHMMDFLEPTEPYSVADYVKAANEVIKDIDGRGRLPVIVGGTGLYINSLADGITFEDFGADEQYREYLNEQANVRGNDYLLDLLKTVDPVLGEILHPNNRKRVIRALEVYRVTGKPLSLFQAESRNAGSIIDPVMIGLNYKDREILYKRIDDRVDMMMEKGLLDEAKRFFCGGSGRTAVQAIGYKELLPFIRGEKELDECLDVLKRQTRRYAKRQITWFKKDNRIKWVLADNYKNLKEIVNFSKKSIAFKLKV